MEIIRKKMHTAIRFARLTVDLAQFGTARGTFEWDAVAVSVVWILAFDIPCTYMCTK